MDYLDAPSALWEAPLPANPENGSQSERLSPAPAPQSPETVAEVPANENLPDSLEAFLQWLRDTPTVGDQRGNSGTVLPYGPTNPDLMIVVAMPDQGGSDPAKIFNPSTEQLVKNMLRAIEISTESVFFAPLSLSRPVEGRIDHGLYPVLKRRMLKLCELVNPKKVILFGDSVTRALCNEELLQARKKKLFINQGSSQTEAIATFHPGILVERPEIKAEAWQDLQRLLGTD
ncbi:uracil-DNA glycosylase family protein [Parasphingorhabdus marina]|uniref:uracil-DNA glycosylase family protein n=1 Tax=Parasphingorhabdus marina TaxID=394732 RepID=UPI0013565806|nr:uracil-DNA glycosylase family protein [Parasphingorhabdus marina]